MNKHVNFYKTVYPEKEVAIRDIIPPASCDKQFEDLGHKKDRTDKNEQLSMKKPVQTYPMTINFFTI